MITSPTSRQRDSSATRGAQATSPTATNGRIQPGASPHLSTSSIFERDVQDPSFPPPASPAIPAHFSTENYIPPVLEATSLAITDSSIDPDRVEIVSSTAHHPALAGSDTYANPTSSDDTTTTSTPHAHSLLPTPLNTTTNTSTGAGSSTSNPEDSQIGYGSSLAQPDTRRLSFISFADVVQAEHDEASQSATNNISPSAVAAAPLDSTIASSLLTSTSASGSGSSSPPSLVPSSLSAMVKDQLQHPHTHSRASLDVQRSGSIGGGGTGSGPTSQGPHGELTVETMSQALRRHGSGDMKALSMSPKVHTPSPLEARNV